MNYLHAASMLTISAALLTGCSTTNDLRISQALMQRDIQALQQDVSELKTQKHERDSILQVQQDKEKEIEKLRSMVDDRVAAYTDFENFLDISLPEDPSEDDIRKYISDILGISKDQRSFATGDLQVQLLVELGGQYMPLLLDALPDNVLSTSNTSSSRGGGKYKTRISSSNSRGRYHLQYAIKALADQSHCELIINYAKATTGNSKTALLDVIEKMKWENQAKDLITDILKESITTSTSSYLNNDLLTMAVRLNDPEINPVLFQAISQSSNLSYNFKKINSMEGFNAQEFMREAWKNRTIQSAKEQLFIAQYAVLDGDLFALDMLVRALTPNPKLKLDFDPRFTLLTALDFRGTSEEIETWYTTNIRSLIFDKEAGKFIIEPAPTQP